MKEGGERDGGKEGGRERGREARREGERARGKFADKSTQMNSIKLHSIFIKITFQHHTLIYF